MEHFGPWGKQAEAYIDLDCESTLHPWTVIPALLPITCACTYLEIADVFFLVCGKPTHRVKLARYSLCPNRHNSSCLFDACDLYPTMPTRNIELNSTNLDQWLSWIETTSGCESRLSQLDPDRARVDEVWNQQIGIGSRSSVYSMNRPHVSYSSFSYTCGFCGLPAAILLQWLSRTLYANIVLPNNSNTSKWDIHKQHFTQNCLTQSMSVNTKCKRMHCRSMISTCNFNCRLCRVLTHW